MVAPETDTRVSRCILMGIEKTTSARLNTTEIETGQMLTFRLSPKVNKHWYKGVYELLR